MGLMMRSVELRSNWNDNIYLGGGIGPTLISNLTGATISLTAGVGAINGGTIVNDGEITMSAAGTGDAAFPPRRHWEKCARAIRRWAIGWARRGAGGINSKRNLKKFPGKNFATRSKSNCSRKARRSMEALGVVKPWGSVLELSALGVVSALGVGPRIVTFVS
jgi:hypothetical protein